MFHREDGWYMGTLQGVALNIGINPVFGCPSDYQEDDPYIAEVLGYMAEYHRLEVIFHEGETMPSFLLLKNGPRERPWSLYAAIHNDDDILKFEYWERVELGHPTIKPLIAAAFLDEIRPHMIQYM